MKKSIAALWIGVSLSVVLFSSQAFAEGEKSAKAKQCERNGINYENAVDFVKNLKNALRANNKSKIADMADYPIMINRHRQRQRIISKSQFLGKYSEVFRENVKEKILDQNPKTLFCNDQGAMIGDGVLWFNAPDRGKAGFFAINP